MMNDLTTAVIKWFNKQNPAAGHGDSHLVKDGGKWKLKFLRCA